MPRRADSLIDGGLPAAHWDGAGTNYIVQTPAGVLYAIYINAQVDVVFRKSTDFGLTWSGSTAVSSGTFTNCTAVAVWYDRWSNIAAGLIHVVYSDSGVDDTAYRTINTESSDALSTETVIFAGASTLAGGHLSVTRAVGGNVYCKTVIDAGTEGGFYRLVNANVPNGAWDAARTVDEAIATLDQMRLLPDFDAADTQDIMALFQDASVTELSRKLYDDSANSWTETSISAAITELSTATAFANFNSAPDISNTRHVVVAWNATDAASQDLLCWTVDSGAITAKTDVVANATDDCGLAAVSIDLQTGYWYVFYGGPSTGTSTWPTSMHVYMKVSQDQGTTWGPETLVDAYPTGLDFRTLYTCPRIYKGPPIAVFQGGISTRDLYASVDRTHTRARFELGV
jgi:hypothetical protein